MRTNYYFKLKGIKSNVIAPSCSTNLINTIQDKMDEFLQEISKIHIGKRSDGWKPLFQQTEYFESVEDTHTRDFSHELVAKYIYICHTNII